MKEKDENIDIGSICAYWVAEAEDDLKVAEHLFDKGDYSYSLFFGHLAIEKILKAIKEIFYWLRLHLKSNIY